MVLSEIQSPTMLDVYPIGYGSRASGDQLSVGFAPTTLKSRLQRPPDGRGVRSLQPVESLRQKGRFRKELKSLTMNDGVRAVVDYVLESI